MNGSERQARYPLNDPTVKTAVDTFMSQQMETTKQSYFYFHAFLQLTDREKWSEKLEADFGSSYHKSFDEFWDEHEEKFQSLRLMKEKGEVDPKVYAELVHTVQENDNFENLVRKIDAIPGELIVRIGVIENEMESTLDAVRDILRSTGKYTVGTTPPGHHHFGDYPLKKKPSNLTLEKIFRVYQAKRATPSKKNYEIGAELMDILGCYSCKLSDNDNPHERRSKKTTLTQVVSRCLRQAKSIISGLEQGRFPEYKA